MKKKTNVNKRNLVPCRGFLQRTKLVGSQKTKRERRILFQSHRKAKTYLESPTIGVSGIYRLFINSLGLLYI